MTPCASPALNTNARNRLLKCCTWSAQAGRAKFTFEAVAAGDVLQNAEFHSRPGPMNLKPALWVTNYLE